MSKGMDKAVADAYQRFEALSPEEQAAHREEQRRSWVRGEMGLHESSAIVKPAMTAPMTPRDPFTDEDVRHAIMARSGVLRQQRYRTTGLVDKAMRAALLAGTERLRAQGTWNEAIEAAAKQSDDRAAYWRTEQKKHKPGSKKYRELGAWAVSHEDRAAANRFLKRPEAP